MLLPILIMVVIVVVGVGVLAYRNRTEKGIESGISSFRRELHALAPQHKDDHRPVDPREETTTDEASAEGDAGSAEDPSDDDPRDA